MMKRENQRASEKKKVKVLCKSVLTRLLRMSTTTIRRSETTSKSPRTPLRNKNTWKLSMMLTIKLKLMKLPPHQWRFKKTTRDKKSITLTKKLEKRKLITNFS